jgi:hypothetical protein
MIPVWTACLTAALACNGLAFRSPPPTAAATPPAETATPSRTGTHTPTSSATRTSSPTLIPGIQEPVNVGDAHLLITKALRRDVFRCGGKSEPIEDPDVEEFLLLLMDVVKGPALTTSQVQAWIRDNDIPRIALTGKTPDERTFSRTCDRLCYERNPETYVLTQLMLGFVIDRDAEDFHVVLPDGMEIPLSSIMP